MSDKDVIGFIGVGYMGHGMAHNIMKGGYSLVIKGNKNRVPVDDLVKSGATEAQNLAELVAKCDVIHMCLSNSPQVENIIFGAGGILENSKDGLIVIDCTTADPTSTTRIGDAMAQKGMHFVDAPLGRTPKEAAEGTLDAMIGASLKLLKEQKKDRLSSHFLTYQFHPKE
jgi:3-hydroxyisobutyrate dehydrogenase-like beta-hydroxyacid dehydrogenase